jgi:hypothetical protein
MLDGAGCRRAPLEHASHGNLLPTGTFTPASEVDRAAQRLSPQGQGP